jgi:MFS family permease
VSERAAGPGRLWSNREFLKLWGGEAVSRVGTQVSTLALPLTAILSLHASARQMGLLGAAQFFPVLLVSTLAGLWADRHRRRPILIAANLGRAALLACVPLLAALHQLRLEHLYLVAFLTGSLTALFDVAYLAYVPTLVRRQGLVAANSALQASYSAAQMAGPGLGGLLVQVLTAPVAVLVDAASYVLATLSLFVIGTREPRPQRAGGGKMLREMGDGFRVTVANRYLRATAFQSGWFNLWEQVVLTLFLLYGTHQLHLSPALLGLIVTLGGVGAVAGSLAAGPAGRRLGVGRSLLGGIGVASLACVLIPLAEGSRATLAGVLMLAFMLYGGGLTVYNVHVVALRQAITRDRLLGRVSASYRLISYGTIPVGSLLAGTLGQSIGLRKTLAVAGGSLVLGWSAFARSAVSRARDAAALEPVE